MHCVETCSSMSGTCVDGMEADCVAPCMYSIVQSSILLYAYCSFSAVIGQIMVT